jgi:predicted DNA-binding transcriptional regulator YafY
LNRIRFFETTSKNFEFPSEFDIDAYLQNSFGIYAGKTERISIRFLPAVADYISDRIWHPSQQLHYLEDGSLIMELEVAGMQEIKAWVLKWGQNAAVIGPDRLKKEIGKELKSMLSYYDP